MKSKIAVLTATMLCIVCYANAQTIEKGKNLISGALGFNSQQTKDIAANQFQEQKYKSANINFQFGKAIKENIFAGVGVGYSPFSSVGNRSNFAEAKSSGTIYSGNVFVRAYKNVGKDFYIFAQPSIGYTFGEGLQERESSRTYWKSSSVGFSVAPGLSYNVYKKLYMDVSLPNVIALTYSTSKNNGLEAKNFNFYTSLNSQILQNLGVGFSFIL